MRAFAPSTFELGQFGRGASAGDWINQDRYHRELADVNGDNRADIVGFGDAGIYVALATTAGHFANSTFELAAFGAGSSGGDWFSNNIYRRELADVNGDNMDDIVGFGDAGTYVALATGAGHFANATFELAAFGAGASGGHWINDNTYHRQLADVNGDGKADIVGFGYAGTYVALATTNGHFANATLESTEFGAGPAAGSWFSDTFYHRELADVNGDGKDDIVGFGHAGIYVSLATTNGHFANSTFELADFGVASGWSNQDARNRQLADVNGDGKADIVGFGPQGTHVALATLNGHFAPANLVFAEFGATDWASENLLPRELADVNGDLKADIVGFNVDGVHVALSEFVLI